MDHQRSRKSSICARTWLVLAYSAVFGFPLSTEEVRRRYWLLGEEIFPTHKDIETSLTTLAKIGWIKKKGEWWHLFTQPEAPRNRAEWLRYSEQKLIEAQPVLSFLSKLPWVLAVAITGSVAVNSAKKDDDVDFMIITEPNRLWITRLLTLIFAMKHDKRRSFAKEEPNSWCFNLWLTSRSLRLSLGRHSFFSAYEFCQAEWVINKKHTVQKFFSGNVWVKKLLPTFFKLKLAAVASSPDANSKINILYKPSLFVVNLFCYLLQIVYMSPHRTIEVVDFDQAWFHPKKKRDPR